MGNNKISEGKEKIVVNNNTHKKILEWYKSSRIKRNHVKIWKYSIEF